MLLFRIPERRRRCILPLTALAVALYYAFVFQPLGRRSAKLDQPLDQTGQELAYTLGRTNLGILDAGAIARQLAETRSALTALLQTARTVVQRITLSEDVQARLRAPFQLVDYQYERQMEQDNLTQLAAKHKVKLDPAVLASIPEHTTDIPNPSLLWAQLEFVHYLLSTAMLNQAAAIHSLDAPSVPTAAVRTNSTRLLVAIPLRVELSGSMDHLLRFLRSLPLRAEELKAAGLPASTPTKPPLFLDHLLLLKHAPLKPDEVTLQLEVTGFVLRDEIGVNLNP